MVRVHCSLPIRLTRRIRTLTTAYSFFKKGKDEDKTIKKYQRVIHNIHKYDILLRKKPKQIFQDVRIDIKSRLKKTIRLSEEERRVDALALGADEGRDKLRKAAGSCK